MNGRSLKPIAMRRVPVFLLFAISALACSNDDADPSMDDGGTRNAQDGATTDVASTADASPVNDAAHDGDGRPSDLRDIALDATRESGGVNDASLDAFLDMAPPVARDAAPGDGAGDAPTDGPLSDLRGDPTSPRFGRSGKYAIVIPPLNDAGAGTSDAGDGGDRGGVGDPADVYYPDPPDLRTGGYAFPVVLLLQGAKVARGFYGGVAALVARYGFIVVVPDHASNNIGGPGLYAELSEIAAAGAQMKLEAASATAPVRGVVDTMRIALMGHSYGGASGLSGMANTCFPPIPLCAFARPPELVAGAFYGTNLATPVLGVPALDTGGLPVLLVQGDRDGKALPADAQRTYEQIQKRPKAILTLMGANHYGVTDVDNPAGADAEVNTQTLDHAEGVASSGRWIGLFFAAFVQGDAAARGALRAAGSFDSHVTITLAE